MLKGINKKDVATLKEPADYAALCKLAVDYSDGVIQNSEHINEDIMDYARQSRKIGTRLSDSRRLRKSWQRVLRQGVGS